MAKSYEDSFTDAHLNPISNCVCRSDGIFNCEQQLTCNKHPDAPHGFNRNASHSADRYVCDCEGWQVEQPAQEPVAWRVLLDEAPEDTDWHYMTGEYWDCYKNSAEALYTHPHQWQGLSDDEIWDIANFLGKNKEWDYPVMFAKTIEQALKEKNT